MSLALVVLGVPSGAHAAVTVGVDLPPAPTGAPITCDTGAPNPVCIALHTAAGALTDGYMVPSDGIITSWRTVKAAPGRVVLTVVRPDGTAGPAEFQQPPTQPSGLPIDGPGVLEVPTRAKVRAGDELGLEFWGQLTSVAADPLAETFLVLGSRPAEDDVEIRPGRVLLQATLEADADNDGYGDDTQDHCPGPKSIPCATLAFAADPAPLAMPGGTATWTVRLTNGGPGHTHPTTYAEVRATRGVQGTVDGGACTATNPTEPDRIRCPLGRMAPGATATLTFTAPQLRAGENRIVISAEPLNTTGLRPAEVFTGPYSTRLTLTTPTLEQLRPAVTVARRLKGGRLGAVVSCPAAGTQDCRVRLQASLVRRGKVVVKAGGPAATVRRGGRRTLRVRLSKRAKAVLRRRGVRVRAAVTRTDVPAGTVTGRGERQVLLRTATR